MITRKEVLFLIAFFLATMFETWWCTLPGFWHWQGVVATSAMGWLGWACGEVIGERKIRREP